MRGAFAALLIVFLSAFGSQAQTCDPAQVELRGEWGQARFSVEIADSLEEQRIGLQNRTSMPSGAGMLFVYDTPGRRVFWMDQTLIPLDLLFLDGQGQVVHIHEGAQPLDRTHIDGGEGVMAVLEINAGLVSALKINVGSALRHPSFSPETAVWPCGAP